MSDSIGSMDEKGGLEPVPELLRQFRHDDFTTRQPARFGLWELAGNVWNLDKVGQAVIPELLAALHAKDHALRVSAIWALYRLAKSNRVAEPEFRDRAVAALIALLDEQDIDVCLSAIYALNWFRDPRVAGALVRHCLNHVDRLVASEAAEALGRTQDKRAVPALLETLKNTKDRMVRISVIDALGALKDARAVQPLIDLLRAGDSLRGYAATALGEIGDKGATPVLLEALRSDPSPDVREWVAYGLMEMKDSRAIPDLIRVLNAHDEKPEPNYRLRFAVVHALQEIGDASALPALMEAIDSAPDWRIRMAAVDALEHVTSPANAASLLIELLHHHKVDYVRGFAARALGYLSNHANDPALRDRVVSHLIEALSDTGAGHHYMPLVRDDAARSLQAIATPEALAAIDGWDPWANGLSKQNGLET
jgi:HEAT repeat protein